MADDEPATTPEVRLRDLRPTDAPVAILARIVTVQRREVVRRTDGGRRPVLSGLLSDGTATVRFTWWDPPAEEIERGTVLRAAPVTVREFRGRPELTFGWRTRVMPASAAELPVLTASELPRRTVRELGAGDEGFALEARVMEVEPKTVTVAGERRQIHQGVLADPTGAVGFTACTDFGLSSGEAVRVLGAYLRTFRGRPQLVLDERSHLERLPTSELPALAVPPGGTVERLGQLATGTGAERVTIEGRALAVQPPSGIVLRCPSCQRLLREGLCRVHGAVTGVPDLRLRLVLADGTGGATVILDRPQTERITGTTLEECRALLQARTDPASFSS